MLNTSVFDFWLDFNLKSNFELHIKPPFEYLCYLV